jgi:hypothetical protein
MQAAEVALLMYSILSILFILSKFFPAAFYLKLLFSSAPV